MVHVNEGEENAGHHQGCTGKRIPYYKTVFFAHHLYICSTAGYTMRKHK